MTEVAVRVSDAWLRLREPADADARSPRVARLVGAGLRTGDGPLVVHDLGSGNGSMGRWLAPLLRGPQHWVLHDRDPDLLAVAVDDPPTAAADGAPVTVEARQGDAHRAARRRPRRGVARHGVRPARRADRRRARPPRAALRRRRLPCPADAVGHGPRRAEPGRPTGPRPGRGLRRPPAAHDRRAQRCSGPTRGGLRRRAVPEPRAPGHHATEPMAARRGEPRRCWRSGSSAGSGPPASSGPSSRPAGGPLPRAAAGRPRGGAAAGHRAARRPAGPATRWRAVTGSARLSGHTGVALGSRPLGGVGRAHGPRPRRGPRGGARRPARTGRPVARRGCGARGGHDGRCRLALADRGLPPGRRAPDADGGGRLLPRPVPQRHPARRGARRRRPRGRARPRGHDVGRGLRAVAWERTAGQVVLAVSAVAVLARGAPVPADPARRPGMGRSPRRC